MAASIVCGVAEEETATRLVDIAADLARRLGLRVVVAHVVTSAASPGVAPLAVPGAVTPAAYGFLFAEPVAPDDDVVNERRSAARRWIGELLAREAVEHAEMRVELGETPAHGLRQIAEEEDAEMLVLASHGHGALRASVLGSTSHELAREAPCPVLVVPAHRTDPERPRGARRAA